MVICTIVGCGREHYSKGYCHRHYDKLRRHGDPLFTKKLKTFEKCKVDLCERKNHAKGYCSTHYAKIKSSGTLDIIKGSEISIQKWRDSRITELSKLDQTLDPRPHRRGFYATNIVSDIKHKAITRSLKWNLTHVEAYKLIISNCNYCGFQPNWPNSRVGIDRVDNTIGYTSNNCVSCCATCNTAKGSMNLEEFILWIKTVHSKIA